MEKLVPEIMDEIEKKTAFDRNQVGIVSENVRQRGILDVDRALLRDKYYFPLSHRKGVIGKFFSFMLKKLFGAVKIFLDSIFTRQEDLNKSLIDRVNKLTLVNQEKDRIIYDLVDEFKKLKLSIGESADSSELLEMNNKIEGFDYLKFEDKHRGEEGLLKERQKIFLDYFKDSNSVLDIGCGRGEFLELLKDMAISAKGIDMNPDMILRCEAKGLDVDMNDANSYLNSVKDFSIGGIVAFQVVEHMKFSYLQKFIDLAYKKLSSGGYLILETPNPYNLGIFSGAFYADPEHTKPIHPELLKFLAEEADFEVVDIKFLSLPSEKDRLSSLKSSDENIEVINKNFEKINKKLFGGGDYALILRKN